MPTLDEEVIGMIMEMSPHFLHAEESWDLNEFLSFNRARLKSKRSRCSKENCELVACASIKSKFGSDINFFIDCLVLDCGGWPLMMPKKHYFVTVSD